MSTPVWFVHLLKRMFPHRHAMARLTRFPGVAAALDQTIFRGDNLIYLPKDRVVIQQAIEPPESMVLPSALVEHFIKKARYRWIMNACICREGDNCQTYPHDLGCIFLGDAVLKINPKFGRLASKDEALAHTRRAAELGLVHLIGRDRIDNIWMGAYPFGKLMTICHCCPCCCLFRMIPHLDSLNRAKITRMPGVSVQVDAKACTGCGKCAHDVCFVNAIEIVRRPGGDHKAQISAECRGCGRCVEACPRQAIHLSIADPNYLQKQAVRISGLVDVE